MRNLCLQCGRSHWPDSFLDDLVCQIRHRDADGQQWVSPNLAHYVRRFGASVCASSDRPGELGVPSWILSLLEACRGASFNGGLEGPWTRIFGYAARRGMREPEFRLALTAAIEGGLLVPFVHQQQDLQQPITTPDSK